MKLLVKITPTFIIPIDPTKELTEEIIPTFELSEKVPPLETTAGKSLDSLMRKISSLLDKGPLEIKSILETEEDNQETLEALEELVEDGRVLKSGEAYIKQISSIKIILRRKNEVANAVN